MYAEAPARVFCWTAGKRMAVVEAVKEEAGEEMAVIVHVGCPDTRHAAELARHAQKAGADATSAVPCVYYHLGEESVYRHWTAITEAADLPFFIYNIPQLTSFNLSMELFERMLANERVAGVKCSSEPCHDILRFKQAGGEGFHCFQRPGRAVSRRKADGCGCGNRRNLRFHARAVPEAGRPDPQREIAKAQQLQIKITQFIYRLCSFLPCTAHARLIIRLDGVDIGDPRLPFLPVDEKDPAIISLYQDIRNAVEETKMVGRSDI